MPEALPTHPEDAMRLGPRWNLQHGATCERRHLDAIPQHRLRVGHVDIRNDVVAETLERRTKGIEKARVAQKEGRALEIIEKWKTY